MKRFQKLMPVELSLAAISGFWGVILLFPQKSFNLSTAYDQLDRIASESTWAVFMLICSLTVLIGMSFNLYNLRRMGLLLSTAIWLFVSSMLLISEPFSTAWGAYLIYAILSSWSYMKVGEQRYGR